MKKDIEFGDGLTGRMEVGNIDWSIFDDQSKIHYIGILNPPRFGVTLFTTMMEHMYFKPGTKKNGLFWLQFLTWGTVVSDGDGQLEVFAKDTTKIVGDKVIHVGDKTFITEKKWDIQQLGWMISTFPADYKAQAEACLKTINMTASNASPVLSKFKVELQGEIGEFPFIAAVKSYKMKGSDVSGPFPGSVIDKDSLYFFPVEGPNIFTIENGPGDHATMMKLGVHRLIEIEHEMCQKINGMADATPEEIERVDKISKTISSFMAKMIKHGKVVKG